jgi:hypothetical protein
MRERPGPRAFSQDIGQILEGWGFLDFLITPLQPQELPPNRGRGDLKLTREGDWQMVLHKDKVEIGNSG